MPLVVKDKDLTQGHCWAPTLPNSTALINTTVFMENEKILVFGDQYFNHIPGCTYPGPSTHPVFATVAASPSVFINNLPIIRDGDPLSCGDAADTIGGTVYSDGGGGNVTVPGQLSPSFTAGYVVGDVSAVYENNNNLIWTRKVIRSVNASGQIIETFVSWCGPKQFPINWRWTLEEEDPVQGQTGNIYYNYKGIGAPDLPPTAPTTLRPPLPTSFELVGNLPQGIVFNPIDGTISGTPPQNLSELNVEVQIKIYYFQSFAQNLRRTITVNLGYTSILNTAPCP